MALKTKVIKVPKGYSFIGTVPPRRRGNLLTLGFKRISKLGRLISKTKFKKVRLPKNSYWKSVESHNPRVGFVTVKYD